MMQLITLPDFKKCLPFVNFFVLGLLFFLGWTQISAQTINTFESTSITIPGDGCNNPCTADPFPSEVVVSGLTQPVSDLRVTLNGFNHDYIADVDILLVAPDGKNVIILSDVWEKGYAEELTITLYDNAPSHIPLNGSGAIPNGTYKPTNHPDQPDIFPNAPAQTTGNTLAAFNGINPNGIWRLYVTDDFPTFSGGSIASWSLTFRATASTAMLSGQVLTRDNNGISDATVSVYHPSGQMQSVITDSLGAFSFANLPTGQTYIVNVDVINQGYEIADNPRVVQLDEDTQIIFVEPTP